MIYNKIKLHGFTLLEMLLVMVIVASIILMVMTYTTTQVDETKRDVTVKQYEQILNAGLAYYINNSTWPNTINDLINGNYLPNKTINNPWASGYTFYQDATTGTFSICSTIMGSTFASGGHARNTAARESNIIANQLPMGYVANSCPASASAPAPTPCGGVPCAVISAVNIPGQNLNNARSINFAGVYHNGACVPAPVCPNTMSPTIIVIPVSVSGTYYGQSNSTYSLNSFTATAVGDANKQPTGTPLTCFSGGTAACDQTTGGDAGLPTSGKYWRVCLDVVTQLGRIGDAGSTWDASSGIILAITRCVPNNEPSGSGFNVFQAK